MYVIRQGTRVSVSTPAKLNLFLELLSRRPDGFHDLDTLMLPVDLFDSLTVQPRDDGEIHLSCRWASGYNSVRGTLSAGELPKAEDNIVMKAMRRLQTQLGTTLGADIELVKRIPSQAGMGGGSSDAMAALIAGDLVWQPDQSAEQRRATFPKLVEIGSELGSDVPFFAFGQLAKCTGRGEVIAPIKTPTRLHFVVVKPEFGMSTPEVFKHSSVAESPSNSDALCAALNTKTTRNSFNLRRIGQLFFNRLQDAAKKINSASSWFERVEHVMKRLSVLGHQMSGSGSSYFALCRNACHARFVAANLRAAQLGSVFVVSSLGLKPTA